MELLAPAGSSAALIAAVQSGADAVYIGGTQFSARRSAQNFTQEDMIRWVNYCHLYGVQVHVAANTLIKEKEAESFLEYIGMLNQIGVDAVIVQDVGMADFISAKYPDLALHASTQMSVASIAGVRYLEQHGFSRVVLARELDKNAIADIIKQAKAEIEVFAHGAICMSYSGQCLMSSMIGGRSGNRGMCAQPCRLPYELLHQGKSRKKGYLLSPKDMCLIDELETLKKIGVTSIKIEGRLKRPEYVSTVVGIYRKYLDSGKKVSASDFEDLKNAFNRSGFTKGYFEGKCDADMMSYETPGNISENLFSEEAKRRCCEENIFRKIPISVEAQLLKDQPLFLKLSDSDGHSVTVNGKCVAEKAINRPLEQSRFSEQVTKFGNTPFAAQRTDIILEEGITVPIKEINETRRKAVSLLQEQRIARAPKTEMSYEIPVFLSVKQSTLQITASVTTKEQAEAVLKFPICRLYAPVSIAGNFADTMETVTVLPAVWRDKTAFPEPVTKSVSIRNLSQIEAFQGYKQYGDYRLNLYNSYSIRQMKAMETVMPSVELNCHELSELKPEVPLELFAYGRVELMVMRNCPSKAILGGCRPDFCELKDRQLQHFPLVCDASCNRILLNAKPIFMADKMRDLQKLPIQFLKLHFTTETPEECKEILSAYFRAFDEKILPPAENTFTRGHFFRGVE